MADPGCYLQREVFTILPLQKHRRPRPAPMFLRWHPLRILPMRTEETGRVEIVILGIASKPCMSYLLCAIFDPDKSALEAEGQKGKPLETEPNQLLSFQRLFCRPFWGFQLSFRMGPNKIFVKPMASQRDLSR